MTAITLCFIHTGFAIPSEDGSPTVAFTCLRRVCAAKAKHGLLVLI